MPFSRLANPGATKQVLEEHGLWAKKSLGQHFLIEDPIIGKILGLAELGPDDVVLEVGPGIGTLTLALCEQPVSVVAVERDEDLIPVLGDTTAECDRLALIVGDALKVSASALSEPFGPPTAFVANLPYEVAATLILRVFEEMPSVSRAVVMVQAEVADRILAKPSTKAYSAYTVKLALRATPTGRFRVAPSCFLPRPRVDSAVVRLDRLERDCSEATLRLCSELAKAGFAQRRKTLRNNLAAHLGGTVHEVEELLLAAGIDPGLRAEALEVEEFVRLAKFIEQSGHLG